MAAYDPAEASMPGDGEQPTGPDQSTVDQMNSAINQGYNYSDVVAYHTDNGLPAPPQPSLDAIMSGSTNDASQWSAPAGDNDPTRLDTNVRAQIDQVVESGLGVGAVEGVGLRAAGLGVKATTEGLQGAMTPLDLAAERYIAQPLARPAVRRGLAAAAGATAFKYAGNKPIGE